MLTNKIKSTRATLSRFSVVSCCEIHNGTTYPLITWKVGAAPRTIKVYSRIFCVGGWGQVYAESKPAMRSLPVSPAYHTDGKWHGGLTPSRQENMRPSKRNSKTIFNPVFVSMAHLYTWQSLFQICGGGGGPTPPVILKGGSGTSPPQSPLGINTDNLLD